MDTDPAVPTAPPAASGARSGSASADVDVLVVGGGAAGLSAATVLGRSRRQVVVVDDGQPRNAPAEGVHAFLGHDGIPPADLLRIGREEVARYGGRVVHGTAVAARAREEGVVVELADGSTWSARHLVVTTGAADRLPQVPGLRERWGRGVIHCPYCHGWEVRDQRLVVLATGPAVVHQVQLFGQLTDHVTVVLHDPAALERAQADRLEALGVEVVPGPALRVLGDARGVTGVEVAGRAVPADAVVVASVVEPRSALLDGLALGLTDIEMMGSVVARAVPADPMGRTAVPRVWVAGNVAEPMAQVVMAAAAGTRVGALVNAELVTEDVEQRLAVVAS